MSRFKIRAVCVKCTTLPLACLGCTCLYSKSFKITVGKKTYNEQFSSSHSAFYTSEKRFAIFIKFKNCRLQGLSIWKSLKFVVWERVKDFTTCNSSPITNRQVCANHNSVMLKGLVVR